jgi:hypothetical protein
MQYPRNITIVLLLAAFASMASAQEAKTRAQVRAELVAAMHNGNMLANGELGLTQRELRPDLYPSPPVVGETRAQVESELAAAIRDGDMIVAGDSGLREKDMAPGRYPADPVVAGTTRAEVKAELAIAIRDGDMMAAGESGLTEYQLGPQRYGHQRAIDAAMRLAQHSAPQTTGAGAQ